jgi:hypothetical protein
MSGSRDVPLTGGLRAVVCQQAMTQPPVHTEAVIPSKEERVAEWLPKLYLILYCVAYAHLGFAAVFEWLVKPAFESVSAIFAVSGCVLLFIIEGAKLRIGKV